MDVSAVTELIGSVGFPIVACVVIAYLFYREQETHKEDNEKFTTAINELNNQFTNAINGLTVALTKLTDLLERSENNES